MRKIGGPHVAAIMNAAGVLGLHAITLTAMTTPLAAADVGTVFISRSSGFVAALAWPEVQINGRTVGTIGSGECLKVQVAPGRQTVVVFDQLTLGTLLGIKRPGVTLTVKAGSTLFVDVEPRLEQLGGSATYVPRVVAKGHRC
jgi:hypothetical protein